MRRARSAELSRFVAPLTHPVDWAWQRMHWWLVAMFVLYLGSGITVIHADEVGVVLRWGHVVGTIEPGITFLLPRPIDRIVRVPVKRVFELRIATLVDPAPMLGLNTLDPIKQGYALTGDHNIVHAQVIAHYRIKDASRYAFYAPTETAIVRACVTMAMVRTLAEDAIDHVLADGRKEVITRATQRAQAALDAAGSGLELTSLELTQLGPPAVLAQEFAAVQSAVIESTTNAKKAQAFAARAVPEAQASANREIEAARGAAATEQARAEGAAAAFVALHDAYVVEPRVVRERLYREGIERALGANPDVRWVPPPVGARYDNLRITIPRSAAGNSEPPSPDSVPSAPTEEEP
jgi:membrane protease subunit HflK